MIPLTMLSFVKNSIHQVNATDDIGKHVCSNTPKEHCGHTHMYVCAASLKQVRSCQGSSSFAPSLFVGCQTDKSTGTEAGISQVRVRSSQCVSSLCPCMTACWRGR